MNNTQRKAWTKDELLIAINLYCKTPFGRIHSRNKDIILLSQLLGRSAGSVSYKLANFASIDPFLPRKGASNVSKLDVQVWNEFFSNWEEMSFESEKLLQNIKKEWDYDNEIFPYGMSRESVVKIRVNQGFFRKAILASYGACCITGLAISELLVASHIVPWSVDEKNRTNPRNGLCLNSLHDKAFDSGLITISEDFRLLASTKLENYISKNMVFFADYIGAKIRLPNRFLPDQTFLQYHRENIFQGKC